MTINYTGNNKIIKKICEVINSGGGGGGGGSTVTVTPKLSTGTNIADITVDGAVSKLYAPSGGSASEVDIPYTIYDSRVEVREGVMKRMGNLCIAAMRFKVLKSLTSSQTSMFTVDASAKPAVVTYAVGRDESASSVDANVSLAGNINVLHNGNVQNHTIGVTLVWYAGS